MGFLGPERKLVEELSVDLDPRGNLETPRGKYNTTVPRLYAAGGECLLYNSLFLSVSAEFFLRVHFTCKEQSI